MTLSKEEKTWILVVDSAKAKIYEWITQDKRVKKIYSRDDDAARMSERDLRADRPGHGQGFKSKIQYTVDEHVSYKTQASEIFLKKLINHLSRGKVSAEYDKLVIISTEKIYQITLQANTKYYRISSWY